MLFADCAATTYEQNPFIATANDAMLPNDSYWQHSQIPKNKVVGELDTALSANIKVISFPIF